MNDEERRRNQRKAEQGDAQAQVREESMLSRTDDGIHGFLQRLVNKRVFIEGIRINYRGTLVQILKGGSNQIEALVLFPCQRISYFEKEGPNQNTTFIHEKPRLIPWDTVHDVGEEAFKGAGRGWNDV